MNLEYFENLGMFLARILRHSPETININIDEHGWANVEELIDGVILAGYRQFSLEQLEYVVKTDDKQRYNFNENHTLIRANQGHSIMVDVEPYELTEEDINSIKILYHGTSSRFTKSIDKKGILKMNRNYVQLSANKETAAIVGNRHNKNFPGTLIIYAIDIVKMFNNGYRLYKSVNNVYLIETVPIEYLIEKTEF